MITDSFEIKIIDFSSCTYELKSFPEGGTPSYCPFEWHYEQECLNPAIDVFSLGVILYNMFTKSVFFNGKSNEGFKRLEKSERNYFWKVIGKQHSLSEELINLMDRLLTIDPDERCKLDWIFEHPLIKNTSENPEEFLIENGFI